MNGSNFVKNLIIHIKYPYTAIVISVMWIGTAIIIGIQNNPNADLLIAATAISTLFIAVLGFSSPKQG